MRKLLIHTVGRFIVWVFYRVEFKTDAGKLILRVEPRWNWVPELDLTGGQDNARWALSKGGS